jgi:hypothetical protein
MFTPRILSPAKLSRAGGCCHPTRKRLPTGWNRKSGHSARVSGAWWSVTGESAQAGATIVLLTSVPGESIPARRSKIMLKVSCFLLSLAILLLSSGCDLQKQDERVRSLEADVKQLKTEVAELKQKPKAAPEHHYELRNEGFRTWRFDSATGDTCIQLTSAGDWKRKETKGESCTCSDAMQHYAAMPSDTEQQQKYAENYNKHVEHVCGYSD